MLKMVVGQSDDPVAEDAIRDAIAQCRGQLGARTAAGGLLFAAFDAFEPAVLGIVLEAFPGLQLMGSTSSAEMSSVGGYREDSLTLALFASDDVDFTVGIADGVDEDMDGACGRAVGDALAGSDKPPRLCVLLSDGLSSQRALEAVRQKLPQEVVVVGGGSSGTTLGSPRPTFQFANDRVVQDGVAVMLFSGELAFSLAVGTGLRPVGPRGVVTRSAYGVILEIDDRPASAFISGYLDTPGPATFGNPLAIRERGASESYLRVLLGIDPGSGGLQTTGLVPVGSTVQLSTASTDEIVAAASDAIRRATRAFPEAAVPSAALIFSCAVRKFLLGSRTGQELAEARSLLSPDVPLAGMYCTGEIAPIGPDGESRFLNESFVALLLGG